MAKIKVTFIFLFVVFCLQFPLVALAEEIEELGDEEWQIIEAKYCTIMCHPNVDIERVNSKIKINFYDLNWGHYSSKNKSLEEQLAEKFDRVFQKVERILDMFPRKIHLKVKIYENQGQLDNAFLQTFEYANRERRISYYVHKYTTIYTTQNIIHPGLIAHEMGHAVIDHYFLILPPEKIKELLAQYVEINLEE